MGSSPMVERFIDRAAFPHRTAYVAVHIDDLEITLDLGVLCPTVSARHFVRQLQRHESLKELLTTRD